MFDAYNNLKVVHMLDAANRTADTTSNKADLAGYESALVIVNVGADADTLSGSVKWDLRLQESNDDSTYTDVAEKDMIGAVSGTTTGIFATSDNAASTDSQSYKVCYRGSKRYLKVILDATGTHSSGCPFSVNAILGRPRVAPVS